MKIGILIPTIYMSVDKYPQMIFAPRELAINLADGLIEKGHEVYFFTSPDTSTKANIVAGDRDLLSEEFIEQKLAGADPERLKWGSFYNTKRDYEIDLTAKAFKMAKEEKLDIIHSYHDTLAHFFNDIISIPTLYTLHDPLPTNNKSLSYWLLSKFKHHSYVSVSNSQRKGAIDLNFAGTVYHGINLQDYEYDNKPEEHLIYFGRVLEDKGTDTAIKVALQINIPIHIATSQTRANRSEEFYNTKVAPYIDGKKIVLCGFFEGKKKSDFIKKGKAFLFPLRWEEPFGLTLIEAMACGTPVIAYNRGSISEIVRDGATGFIIDPDDQDRHGKGSWVIKKQGMEGLMEAVKRIGEIDRRACRKHVEENFTVEKMVENYEKIYNEILSKNRG